ncbi:MAG: cytochrome P450 [Acidimicrobiales bacterium]|nr:cytochrome P450 [Acidimicrobiales bacterium]
MSPDLDGVDLLSDELWQRGFPHELFTELRRTAPVWWHPPTPEAERLAGGGFWVVSGHPEVQAANRNVEVFSSADGPSLAARDDRQSGTPLVGQDPPEHTRFRKLLNRGFTPRMIGMLEEQIAGWARRVVDAALDKGEVDFVAEVAYPLPMHMIADIVGIPAEDRLALFDKLMLVLAGFDPASEVSNAERNALEAEVFHYAHALGEQKRSTPEDDVWTKLTSSGLSEFELDMFFMVLTLAGSETTRNTIAAGLLALIDNPDQLDLLRREPGRIPTAVDELVRWTSPVGYFRRTVTSDTELGGVAIAAGDRITMWYPSANRDERVFDEPFRFDVTRTPNPHVAFGGGGPHYCLGANLAKREIRVMFEQLLPRVAEFELLGQPTLSTPGIANPISVSHNTVPLRLTPA